MPAIYMPRLKRQAAELAEAFHQPAKFIHHLSSMLEYYADRTHRPAQTGNPPPLIPAFHVPAPVLKQITGELEQPCQADPQAAFDLADALWEGRALEYRLLAARLLGLVPPSPVKPVVERVVNWAGENEEEQILSALADKSMARLRVEATVEFMERVRQWLASEKLHERKLGLRALHGLLAHTEYQNLPAVYRLLAPTLETEAKQLRPDLLHLVKLLAGRSPQETAHFLHQGLEATENQTLAWLIRRSLGNFPLEIEAELRESLKKA